MYRGEFKRITPLNLLMVAPLRVLCISGSLPLSSTNGRILEIVTERISAQGAEAKIWDLAENPLPLVGAEGSWNDPKVAEFQEFASICDAYILSTPEYHGSYSSVLKHQLDWLYSSHVGGKPFALISTLGGRSSNNALNHLRIVVRWVHGHCIPEQIAVPHAKESFDDDGNLNSEELSDRLDALVASLVDHAAFYRERSKSLEA